MTQQQKKETPKKTPQKKRSTNPLMAAFKKDRNTPESLEKLRNDAALKSINKGRSNRGQKPLDKLPDALAKKSAARLKTKKTKTNPKRASNAPGAKSPMTGTNPKPKPTGTGKGSGGSRTKVDKNTSTPQNPLWGKPKPEKRIKPLW